MTRAREEYAPRRMPAAHWANIREDVLAVVERVSVKTPYAARDLMNVVGQHFDFCIRVCGYPREVEFLLRRDVIVMFINHLHATTPMTDSSLATYRSRLFRVADASIGHVQPTHRMPGLRTHETARPFTPTEVLALRRWADGQPSRIKRVDLNVLLALTLGAGLTTGELIESCASDVTSDREGVLVCVRGARPRVVPMLAEWEAVIADVADAAWKPDLPLFRATRTTTDSNLVANCIHKSKAKPFPVNATRLRATWIVTHLAAGTPVQALLDASGVETIGALGRFMAHVPAVDPREARVALTRRARVEGCRATVHGHDLKLPEGP